MKHKKLSARILSLALSAAMLFSMMPTTVFATGGDIPIGASSIEKSERTITAFDELGDGLTKSVPFDGHTYALTVKLNTPIEEIKLPTELGVTVERTTITTPPEKDEVQDSGEVPKDTSPTDEPTDLETEDKTDTDTSIADDSVKSEPTGVEQEPIDTDTTVSGNEPATPSEIEPAPAPEQGEEVITTTVKSETIPVTWSSDKEYKSNENGKFIYTAEISEDYILADGVKLPQIYVAVGRQARTGSDAITININNGTTGGGASLQAVVEANGAASAVTSLTITAGEVTTADWKYLKSLTALETFAIDNAVTTVADIPAGAASSVIFPKTIVSVTVPQAITIGDYAFYSCAALTTATFPEATTIGEKAFYSCTDLASANFPEATSIGAKAFFECTNLTTASFPKAESIGDSAFFKCTKLTTVSFPKAESIGNYAFNRCTNLTTASFPKATNIAYYAFYDCTALSTLTVGATPPTVGSNAFKNCPATRALGYVGADGAALTGEALTTAQGNYKAASDGNTTDGKWYGWMIEAPKIMVTAKINGTPTPLSGDSLAAILADNKTDITELTITTGEVTTEDWRYLKNLTALTDFEIADDPAVTSVKDMPNYMGFSIFPNSIVTVTVPQAVKIGGSAFYKCVALTTVDIPLAIDVGPSAFYECAALTTVSFPKATYIDGNAFKGCTKLTTATFPAVTGIGLSAFEGCAKLATLNLGAIPPTATSNAFTGCPTPRALGYLAADGTALTADTTPTLAAAQTAYGNAADDDSDISTWYGWATGAIEIPDYTGTQAAAPSSTPVSKTGTGITLAPVTVSGETIEYAKSTTSTAPTTGWQDSTAFTGLTADTQYYFFARVKANTTHKAGAASAGTAIKTDKSDADKLADAKTAVTAALNSFTATNAADADAMIALANKAISDAGITGVTVSWDVNGAFSKTAATEDTAGSVTGTIKLTCGAANDTVAFDKTITKLPSDPNAKIATVKAAIEAALNSYTATNATTAADIKAIVDKANTDTGITGVTVAWKSPSDFNNQNSTDMANGKVTGTLDLSCTTSSGSATDTISVNRPIERSDEQKLADAKSKVAAALAAMTATNATTDADVLTAVNNALSGTGVTTAWKTGSGFDKTLATKDASGLITGVIELTLNGKKSDANVNLIIAQLAGDKKALTDAITDANNAKNGIVINNGSPSSVASGTKFVSDAEMKAFTDAIAAAQTVANKPSATEAEITAAVTALNNAVSTFKAAIKTGTYSGGGGGGGGGGGSSSGGTTTPPVVVPPTTTKPNPPTTVETKVPATVDKNGNATVNVTDKTMQDAIDKAVAEAKKNGTSGNGVAVVISVTTGGKDANTVTVNLPKTVQEKVIAGNVVNTVVVVDRPDIAINMNLATITEINKQAKADVQLSATRMDNSKLSADAKTAIGNRPTFDLKATYAGGTKAVTSFGTGSVTIEIPYALQKGEVAGGLYAVYVDGNGKVSYITNSSYDANAKVLRFATNHFSVYGIGYKAPTGFTDIAGHWAKDDIEYVVNRGLFSGTSSTTFAPNGAMTRGMFVTALGRLAGADVSSYKASTFSDVKADAYYMGYIEWASKNGIVKGIGEGKFAPDQSITREQMAVIIESYAKAIGYTMPNVHAENTFADSAKIGTWAKDSVKKVQMAGVISGKSNNVFDPQGTATRAEVSAVLHRFIEIVISTDTAQGWTMNDSGKWMYYENGKSITGKKTIAGKSYEFNTTGELIEGNNNPETGGPITSGYTVVKDDSWWRIAKKYNVNMFTLAKINNKTIFSIIHPGDVLQIPQD